MKILFLSKRAYTGKDLLAERYGRVYEFSRQLADQGHRVRGIALDYRRGAQAAAGWAQAANPEWRSFPLFPWPPGGLRRYLQAIRQTMSVFAPDVVVSVSDVFHVILGDRLARRYGSVHVADLYDDYECFAAARLPGARRWFRKALSRAHGISCVSNILKEHVLATAAPACDPCVIRNGVDRGRFQPQDKSACRDRFNLPVQALLVGLGGAIAKSRGGQELLDAYRTLHAQRPDIHLVLAGRVMGGLEIPVADTIHYLGELAYDEMPVFYNALDVGVITNIRSAFARYCFPQKFHEMRACNLPAVVAAIGDVTESMQQCRHGLYEPGNHAALAAALLRQVEQRCLPDIPVPDWEQQGALLLAYLERVHAAARRQA
jgi:glycosyltransferase involved in cell wall biosynthesis